MNMKNTVVHRATYIGPNPWAAEPVVVLSLELDAQLLAMAEQAVSAFLALSPPWVSAFARCDETGQRLVEEGGDGEAWSAERLAILLARWTLGALNYARGCLRVAGARRGDGNRAFEVWLGYHQPVLSVDAFRLALRLLESSASGALHPGEGARALEPLWLACRQGHPDYQANILMTAAHALDVPYQPAWGQPRHWQYGHGVRGRVLFESGPSDDGWLGGRVSRSKLASKQALVALGLPTPRYAVVMEAAELATAVEQVGWPCATKPLDLGGGKGVSAGHQMPAALVAGFQHARAASQGPVLVEAFVPGDDHRLMVVDGRLRAVIRREPAQVVGDGRQTVAQLVQALNAVRDERSLVASGFMRPIRMDAAALQHLAAQGVGLQTVLATGRRVRLRSTANLSTGGFCTDVTGQEHPQLRAMAEMLASSLGLRTMGADFLTTDIGRPPQEVGGAFIEFNQVPGLDALITAGWTPQEAGALALGDRVGRIALDLLLVPDADVSVMQERLAATGLAPSRGWASLSRAQLGGVPLAFPPSPPWAGLRCLLAHRSATAVLLLCGLRELERHGLPVDRVDRVVLGGVEPGDVWGQVLSNAAGACSKWPDAHTALDAVVISSAGLSGGDDGLGDGK